MDSGNVEGGMEKNTINTQAVDIYSDVDKISLDSSFYRNNHIKRKITSSV